MFGHRQEGFTGIEIAILVGVVALVGALIPAVTGKADTPLEQLSENILKMETGQTVDFSARLKKDEAGNVSATNMHAETIKPPTNTVVIPSTYGK